jgi:hypothetical protein
MQSVFEVQLVVIDGREVDVRVPQRTNAVEHQPSSIMKTVDRNCQTCNRTDLLVCKIVPILARVRVPVFATVRDYTYVPILARVHDCTSAGIHDYIYVLLLATNFGLSERTKPIT